MLKGLFHLGYSYKNTLMYVALIILTNTLFSRLPLVSVLGAEISPMDPTVGIIYVLRDLVQREMGHKVILAMLIGSLLSYFLADKQVAIASVSAFLVAEFVDWGVYTFTRRPLAKRIKLSASLSSPLDSMIFLAMVHQLNSLGFIILTLAKLGGVWAVCYLWSLRRPVESVCSELAMRANHQSQSIQQSR